MIIINNPFTKLKLKQRKGKKRLAIQNRKGLKALKYGIIYVSLFLFLLDSLYRIINNINYYNRYDCVFYKNSSRIIFLIYENFIELWVVMIFGILCAVILRKYFQTYGRFYPKGPISAFLYGSLIPICACSAIPLLSTLKGKMQFRTIITFVLASPLLSPVILILSVSVLGVKYTILRVICSFILAVSAGFLLELFYKPDDKVSFNEALECREGCSTTDGGIMEEVWRLAYKLLPYILIAGIITAFFSMFQNRAVLYLIDIVNSWYGIILAVVIGIPLYVCSGADIFLIRPLFTEQAVVPYGQAVAFSLSASVICLPSIVLLSKVLGKKLTAILTAYIFLVCIIMGVIIKLIFD